MASKHIQLVEQVPSFSVSNGGARRNSDVHLISTVPSHEGNDVSFGSTVPLHGYEWPFIPPLPTLQGQWRFSPGRNHNELDNGVPPISGDFSHRWMQNNNSAMADTSSIPSQHLKAYEGQPLHSYSDLYAPSMFNVDSANTLSSEPMEQSFQSLDSFDFATSDRCSIDFHDESLESAEQVGSRASHLSAGKHNRPGDLTARLAALVGKATEQEATTAAGAMSPYPCCPGRKVKQHHSLELIKISGRSKRPHVILKARNGDKKRVVDLTNEESAPPSVGAMEALESERLVQSRLLGLAEAVATYDQERCGYLLQLLHPEMSAHGSPLQRTAFYLVQGLSARSAAQGSFLWNNPPLSNQLEVAEAVALFAARLPYIEFAIASSNAAIMDTVKDASRVHIVDFSNFQSQWPALMRQLACRPGGPPCLRITSVDAPPISAVRRPGGSNFGKLLKSTAGMLGIYLEYAQVRCRMEDVSAALLSLRSGEVLAVNCPMKLRHLPDASVVRHSPRDTVIQKIHQMCPQIVTLAELDADHNGPFFLSRFKQVLHCYANIFDSLDYAYPRDCAKRVLFEREILARDIVNVIACEGMERMARAETLASWQARLRKAFFTHSCFSESARDEIQRLVERYSAGFGIICSTGAIQLTWKGQSILASSAWRPLLP